MLDVKSPSALDALVGTKIREARRAKRLSQTELGELTGRSFQQIQKYEKGINRVSAGVLYVMSCVLDRELKWFFLDNAK